MTRVSIYLREGRVYLPTLAISRDGVITMHDPVLVIPVTEPDRVALAVATAISEPLAQVDLISPSVLDRKPGVLAQAAKVRSWAAFARPAQLWVLRHRDGHLALMSAHHAYNLAFQEDPEPVRTWPKGADTATVGTEAVRLILDALHATVPRPLDRAT